MSSCPQTRRPRNKQPRPGTSVAGTTMHESGHDRAQRGQNPGITEAFFFFLAPRPRCKQPRPQTSVAGTAMQDSGHDRAPRSQNPGITQIARRSSIYERFCVFLAPRPRCKQPRPKTSVAGTAMQDSGHDRAQRG